MAGGKTSHPTQRASGARWADRRARRGLRFEALEPRQLLTSSAVVTFETTDASGNVLTSVPVGTSFQLRAIVQDTSGRGANGGVFETELDGTYNSALASIPSDSKHSVVTFGPSFINGQIENTQTPGLIYDTGGFGGLYSPGSAPQILFTVPVTASAPGTETFTPALSVALGAAVSVYGDNTALAGSQLTFVPATITITGTQPIIVVSGSGNSIADGSTTPSVAQGTDFGLHEVGGNPLTETYTIANNGTTPLSVGQVALGGADPSDFSVATQPASTVSPGSSTTFSVQFVAGAAGARTATVSFSQNDPSQSTPFAFDIVGEGTTAQLVVTGLGQAIADGAQTTDATDGTDFGVAPPGNTPVVETFDLTNTGTTPVNLSSITVGGPNAGDFTVGSATGGPIAPGTTQTFTVSFVPLAGPSGQRLATVSIDDDDSTQPNPFTFAVSGVAQFPTVAVSGNGSPIGAGDTTTSALNGTDFGSQFANTDDAGVGQVFTITNGGTTTLTVGQVTLTQNGGGAFSVTQQPAQTLGPGASTTFSLAFTPTALGGQSAVVIFTQSDPAQVSPFTFAVSGTGVSSTANNLVTVDFETTDSSGNVLTSVPVGTAFQLRAVVQDNSGRGVNGGVFETELNGTYDPSLASIPSDAIHPVVTFGPDFFNGQIENTQTPGLIFYTGGFGGIYLPGSSAPQLLFTIPVTATTAGVETFTPSVDAVAGAEVSVYGDNSPLAQSQITFVPATIQITGGQPTITVTGGGELVDSSDSPSPANDTDFGAAAYGGLPLSQTYTIRNSGTGDLTLSNLSIDGTNSGDFTVTTPQAPSVVPGGLTTFTVQFAPAALGTRTATISFDENDPTQADPFTFPIQGEALPGVSVADAQATVPDDSTLSTAATFTVSLSAAASQTVTVNYTTADGTAVAGTDYQATSGTLTFLPGTTSQTISVTVNGTLYANPTKQFSVSLTQPGGAILTGATGTGSIINNNVPTWTNPTVSTDVNGDGAVTPIDALVEINYLNTTGESADPAPPDGKHAFLDVNKDGSITPLDALVVIDQIDTATAQAQAQAAAQAQALAAATASALPAATTSLAVGPAVAVTAATSGATNASSAPASQLVDLAMAVYNGEDLALAGSSLPGPLGKSRAAGLH